MMQIVAPAGNFNGLRACVKAGADAVYLGMPHFGARAKAENFDEHTLTDAIEYAHLFGVKVFITLNTLIKDNEMSRAVQSAELAYKAGADAAIVQDLRFIKQLKRDLPELTLHASTQMGIHNALGAQTVLDLGIKRAVLARETLPVDIVEIKKTGIDIEYFVQGALCVCFSGNCYFSSIASSYSGNRGKCMQLCRKPYYFDNRKGYFLSAKDLCLYDRLKELESLGVDAIKIEGRMRSEEYAYTAVDVYKSDLSTEKAKQRLKQVFNRGDYFDGYLDKDAPFRVIYPQSQANIGTVVGKITEIQGNRISVKDFKPHDNDGFKVMRDSKEICGASMRNGVILADGNCKKGDEVRRTFDAKLSEEIKNIDRKLPVEVTVTLKIGEHAVAEIRSAEVYVKCIGDDTVQQAITEGISVEDIVRIFGKVADYPFAPKIETNISGDCFMPVSSLNKLRRNAYEQIKKAIIEKYLPLRTVSDPYKLEYNKFSGHGTLLMIERSEQLDSDIDSKVDYLVLNPRDYGKFDIPKTDKPILLNMPITMRGEDRDILIKAVNRPEIYGVVSNNLYTLGLTDKPVLLGVGHNIIGHTDLPHITSFESDCADGGFLYVFGYAPVMTLCHCPYGKCINCSGNAELKDESGRVFKMRRFKAAHCYWQLLNNVPHNVNTNGVNKFFDCTELNKHTIKTVLSGEYKGAFTRGNMNKGLK